MQGPATFCESTSVDRRSSTSVKMADDSHFYGNGADIRKALKEYLANEIADQRVGDADPNDPIGYLGVSCLL